MSGDFFLLRVGEIISIGFDWDEDGWLAGASVTSSGWSIGPSDAPALSSGIHDSRTTGIIIGPASADHANREFQVTNSIIDSTNETGVRAVSVRVTYA